MGPIIEAIKKVISLGGFSNVHVFEESVIEGKINCICMVESYTESFLKILSGNSLKTLPPIILVSFSSETDFKIFQHLSKHPAFSGAIKYLQMSGSLVKELYCAISSITVKSLTNPFNGIRSLADSLEIPENMSILFGEISEILVAEAEGKNRRMKDYHGLSTEESRKRRISYECCLEYIYASIEPAKWKKRKVLWIEDNPDAIKHVKDVLFTYFDYEFFPISNDDIDGCYEKIKSGQEEHEKYDLILLDMLLHKESANAISGIDFLKALSKNYPHIPVFIVSSTEDFDLVSETLKEGADFFVYKKYSMSVPYYLRRCFENLGKILLLFKEDKKHLLTNLAGNLRYWRFNPNLLWFGDKCYHMINHSFEHTVNDWNILNELLYPLMERNEIIGQTNLYCLCMAVWLHDIGHSGNWRYGAPYEIRDNHGIISGEAVLTSPRRYRVYIDNEDSEIETLFSGMMFPFGPHKKPALQIIRENAQNRKKLSIMEKIALLCVCHKSNSPITQEEYISLIKKEKHIPIDFFENCNRQNKVITLDDILSSLPARERKEIKQIAFLLRFVDALDIKINRVGAKEQKELKTSLIGQDKIYLLSRLKKEIESIIQRTESLGGTIAPLNKMALIKLFYQDVKEKIEKGDSVSHLELPALAPAVAEDVENYFMLANYASFISVQDGHFDFHSNIDSLDIRHEGNNEISILYKTNEDLEKLKRAEIVRDPGDKDTKTLIQRLLGTKEKQYKDGYVIKEYESEGSILSEIFQLKSVVLLGINGSASVTFNHKTNSWIYSESLA